MTNTYLIQAWCVRPFISYLDPVEADSPEEAITIARHQQAKLLDAAEECNGEYPWDEFAVHDEHGNELLHVLDPDARLRDAAPAMRETLAHVTPVLVFVAQVLTTCKPESLPPGMDAALEHIEQILAIASNASASLANATAANDQD